MGGSLENFKILIFFNLWALRAREISLHDPDFLIPEALQIGVALSILVWSGKL